MTRNLVDIPESAKARLQPSEVRSVRYVLAVVALVAAVGCVVAVFQNPEQFFFRYLVAVVFLVSLGAGSLFWLLLHYLTGASWSMVMRRLIEHATTVLLPAAVLFVPVALGMQYVYSWTETDPDPFVASKQPYLNRPFFLMRSAGYFVIWISVATAFRKSSLRQDNQSVRSHLAKLRTWSAPAMVLLGVTSTFAAFDWIMSLDPHWHSNIFGVYFWAGAFSSSLALLTLLAVWTRRRWGLDGVITSEHLHDLGKLQLGFVSFWAYIAFSQYLLIWYAAIPEETVWYAHRSTPGWRELGLILACGHFFAPFFILLPRNAKRSPTILAAVSGGILIFHALDVYWQIVPTLGPGAFGLHWVDAVVWPLMVAVLLWTILTASVNHALAPINDPELVPAVAFENE